MDSHVPALHRTVLVTGEGTSSELDSPGSMDFRHCSLFAAVSSWDIAFSASTIASISTERTMSNSQLGILVCRGPGCVCTQSGKQRVAPHGTWADLLWMPRLRDVAAFQLQLASPCGCTWQRVEQDMAQLFSALRSSQ